MPRAEFESLKFGFTSQWDPLTEAPISLVYNAQDFIKVTGQAAQGLIK